MVFGLWGKKGPKSVDEPDEVYMRRTLADAALVRAAKASPLDVIVASFFPKSLDRIEQSLIAGAPELGCQRINGRRWPSGPRSQTKCWLLDANQVTDATGFDTWLLTAEAPFSFLFVEHFPRWSTERAVLDLLDQGSTEYAQRVRFFVGLDEPLMRAFDGDKVMSLMRKLGMQEDEKLASSMIDKSIANAQKKLDARVSVSSAASSDEEWFALNLGS